MTAPSDLRFIVPMIVAADTDELPIQDNTRYVRVLTHSLPDSNNFTLDNYRLAYRDRS